MFRVVWESAHIRLSKVHNSRVTPDQNRSNLLSLSAPTIIIGLLKFLAFFVTKGLGDRSYGTQTTYRSTSRLLILSLEVPTRANGILGSFLVDCQVDPISLTGVGYIPTLYGLLTV